MSLHSRRLSNHAVRLFLRSVERWAFEKLSGIDSNEAARHPFEVVLRKLLKAREIRPAT
jgi:hypothetical protein